MVRRPSLRMATTAVVAACSVMVGTLATLPGTPEQLSTSGGPGRADPGSAVAKGHFKPVPLTDKTKPNPRVLSHPAELALHAAQSKTFSLKSLKSNVVKVERPETQTPGLVDRDAPAGGDPTDTVQNDSDQPSADAPVQQPAMSALTAAAPAPSTSFDGLDFATWGQGHPPDPNGDVGPSYYIQSINVSIGVFDKSNGNNVAAFTYNALMSQGQFGNLCDTDNFGDGVVLYDSYEDRWFVTDFAFQLDSSGNVLNQAVFQCFAVSQTGDPVNGGWNFYSIQDPGGLGDYPKFGVWPDGIYMSANMFDYSAAGGYQAFHVWAINKQQMYAGAPTVQIVDFAGDSSDFTLLPANSRLQTGTPPSGSPEYFVSTEQFLDALSIYKFHVDWDKISTSTFSGPFVQQEADCWPNSNPANASTPANANDVLAIRAMAQAQYANIGGSESVWVDHTVNRGTFPTASCGGTNSNNATVRWYQANVTGGTIAANVVQGATYDPDGANTYFRYVPSLAVDRLGDMAVGYSKSNSTTDPQIKYAGRLAGDPLNTLSQSEQTLIDGTGSQSGNCGGSTCTRWGDYTGMALDPDGCAFWMTNEYYAQDGLNYLTRVGSFSYPGCTPVGNGTLSGTVTDGTNPIAGATVTLGSRTVTTDGSGHYSFTVPAGTYPTETAAMDGFGPSTVTTIAVPSGGSATRNFALSAAAQSGCFTDDTQGQLQRGAPSNCNLVASPGNIVLATPDDTTTRNDTVNTTGFSFTNTIWAGQTFTPTVSGKLTRVDVELFCASCTANSPDLTLSVRATTTGTTPVPTGSDLATATLTGFNDGGAGGLKTFIFASPFTVTGGTRYAFVFRLNSSFANGTMAYTCSCTGKNTGSNPYTSGRRVTSSNSGSTWSADTTSGGRDLRFVAHINPGYAASGTYISSLKDANPAPGSTPTWTTLSFADTTPSGTNVKFQVAASDSSYGPFTFVGPDGTSGTFFTTTGADLSQFDGQRFLKYKAFLATSNPTVTPSIGQVQVCFNDQGAAASTTLTAADATGTYGGTSSLSATLMAGANPVVGKSISFSLNGSSVGSASTDASGVATLNGASLSGITVGTYSTGVSASWAGDGGFSASSDTAQLTVAQASTSVSVSSSANPSVFSQSVKFTANVTSAGGTPTGTVQFQVDGVNFGTPVAVDGTGKATSAASTTLAVGSRAISAVYSGDANFSTNTGSTSQTVNKASVSVVLTSNHNPVVKGTSITFTITVSPNSPATKVPGGKVRLVKNGTVIKTAHKLSAGKATYTFTWTYATGTFSMTAKYLGTANFNAAVSPVYSQVVTT